MVVVTSPGSENRPCAAFQTMESQGYAVKPGPIVVDDQVPLAVALAVYTKRCVSSSVGAV